jgi:hypothetical protein
MKCIMRIIIFSLVAIVLAGGLIWGFLAGRTAQSAEAESEAPVQAPSRVASKNGETILTFDAAAQRANGIVTATLSRNKRSVEVQATGVVLQLQSILDLKTSYNTTSTDLVKARATARASLAEYDRLRDLNQNGKNASDKAVETARSFRKRCRSRAKCRAIHRSSQEFNTAPLGTSRCKLARARLTATGGVALAAHFSAAGNGCRQWQLRRALGWRAKCVQPHNLASSQLCPKTASDIERSAPRALNQIEFNSYL